MSRGAGSVQRGIIAAFEAAPGRRFTVEELAAEVYCQSACKTDPLSASKIDPPMHCRDQGLSRRN